MLGGDFDGILAVHGYGFMRRAVVGWSHGDMKYILLVVHHGGIFAAQWTGREIGMDMARRYRKSGWVRYYVNGL